MRQRAKDTEVCVCGGGGGRQRKKIPRDRWGGGGGRRRSEDIGGMGQRAKDRRERE